MRVRVNSEYIYSPNLLDTINGRTNLKDGEQVRVVNIHGCPPANTMQHCYVVRVSDPETFVGLVHCNSLHTRADYVAYLRAKIARMEEQR